MALIMRQTRRAVGRNSPAAPSTASPRASVCRAASSTSWVTSPAPSRRARARRILPRTFAASSAKTS
eukprot:8929989-Lingulodinium_polyedra.AAC.1